MVKEGNDLHPDAPFVSGQERKGSAGLKSLWTRSHVIYVWYCCIYLPCNPTLRSLHCLSWWMQRDKEGVYVPVWVCVSMHVQVFYCHFINLEPWGKSKRLLSVMVEGSVSGADQRRLRGRCCSLAGLSAACLQEEPGVERGGWGGRGGGGGGGGISSLCKLFESPGPLGRSWEWWALELVRVGVRWVWVGIGVRARQTSPSLSWRQGRPYSCVVLWGEQEDHPWSCTKNGYSTKTCNNSWELRSVRWTWRWLKPCVLLGEMTRTVQVLRWNSGDVSALLRKSSVLSSSTRFNRPLANSIRDPLVKWGRSAGGDGRRAEDGVWGLEGEKALPLSLLRRLSYSMSFSWSLSRCNCFSFTLPLSLSLWWTLCLSWSLSHSLWDLSWLLGRLRGGEYLSVCCLGPGSLGRLYESVPEELERGYAWAWGLGWVTDPKE